jgi:hypothetical protein
MAMDIKLPYRERFGALIALFSNALLATLGIDGPEDAGQEDAGGCGTRMRDRRNNFRIKWDVVVLALRWPVAD